MDIQEEKLNILKTIITSDDESLIMDVKALLADRQPDWFDGLNPEQQNDVLAGLAEAENGETLPHADVVKIFGKWGLK